MKQNYMVSLCHWKKSTKAYRILVLVNKLQLQNKVFVFCILWCCINISPIKLFFILVIHHKHVVFILVQELCEHIHEQMQ